MSVSIRHTPYMTHRRVDGKISPSCIRLRTLSEMIDRFESKASLIKSGGVSVKPHIPQSQSYRPPEDRSLALREAVQQADPESVIEFENLRSQLWCQGMYFDKSINSTDYLKSTQNK